MMIAPGACDGSRACLLLNRFRKPINLIFHKKQKGIIMILNIVPILAAAAAPNAQQIDSVIESRLNEADQVVHEIEDQGVGFFPNLWHNHSDDILRFAKTVILAIIVLVAIKLFCVVAKKLIARSFNRFEAMDNSLKSLDMK